MDSRGARIRKLRKAKGLNQTQLGALVGVDQSTVTDWEKYDAEPGYEKLLALAKALEASVAYLMDGSDERSWPFPLIPMERFIALDETQRGVVQGAMLNAITHCESQAKSSTPHTIQTGEAADVTKQTPDSEPTKNTSRRVHRSGSTLEGQFIVRTKPDAQSRPAKRVQKPRTR